MFTIKQLVEQHSQYMEQYKDAHRTVDQIHGALAVLEQQIRTLKEKDAQKKEEELKEQEAKEQSNEQTELA